MKKLKLAMLFALAFSPCLLHGLEDILSQIKRGEKYPVPAEAQQYGERQERYHPIDPRTGRAMLDTRGNRVIRTRTVREWITKDRVIRTRTVREWITKDQVNQIRGLISAHEDRFRALHNAEKTISRDEYFRLIDNATAAIQLMAIGGMFSIRATTANGILHFVNAAKLYLAGIGMMKHSVYKYAIKRLLEATKPRIDPAIFRVRGGPILREEFIELYREFGIKY
jgi:hypothetical protein